MICSPLIETEQELVKLAKKLKKENVSVDVINFGEDEQNVERLVKFIETLNGKNVSPDQINCHLINIPSGSNVNDAVRNSAICGASQSTSVGITGGAAQGMDLGGGQEDWMDDPNMDPDLALALRVSLEESHARQQQENSAANNAGGNLAAIAEESTGAAAAGATGTTGAAGTATEANDNADDDDMEDLQDEDIMAALQMSLANQEGDGDDDEDDDDEDGEGGEANLQAMTEEEQIEFALRMSMQDSEKKEEDGDMK